MLGTVWNLLGRIGPLLIALAVTPGLVASLGVTRWGIYTIALSLIGVFGIFDFGIGRALTRSVAEKVGAGEEHSAADLVLTGLLVLAGFGAGGGLVAAAGVRYWVEHGLHVEAELQREVLISFYLLCISAPLVIATAAMWGVVGAYQNFRAANLIGIPLQAFYYVGPLAILQVWDSLVAAMLVVVVCRAVSVVVYWRLCLRIMPSLRKARLNLHALWPLMRMGGWMTVSNVAWPVLMYADRFIIASVLTAAATAYYATPFDVVSRFSIVPVAIMSSAYPAMAVSFRSHPVATETLFRRSILAIGLTLFPLCLVAVSFSTELMALWIGSDFARHSAPVLRWLGVGAFVAATGSVAAGLIDAVGRPDLNAKLSLLELGGSAPLLLALLHWFGIEGAAIAWTLRCCVDLAARLVLVARYYRSVNPAIRGTLPTVIGGTGLLVLPGFFPNPASRLLVDVGVLSLYLALWFGVSLTGADRDWFRDWQLRMRKRSS